MYRIRIAEIVRCFRPRFDSSPWQYDADAAIDRGPWYDSMVMYDDMGAAVLMQLSVVLYVVKLPFGKYRPKYIR